MSYHLNVYTESDQPVSRSELTAKMRAAGWEIVFVSDWNTVEPSSGERVADNDLVLGWRSDSELSGEIRRACHDRNRVALERLYEEMAYGTCGLFVGPPLIDEDPEILDSVPEQYVETVRKARLFYYVRTSGSSGPVSDELQQDLWRAIGEVSAGLLVDPETDSYTDSYERPPEPRRRVPGLSVVLGPARPPWWVIGWYSVIALLGVALVVLGRNPLLLKNWFVLLLCAHGLLAYGLYRRQRWAWFASIGLAALLTIACALSMLVGRYFRAAPILLFQAFVLSQLLSNETRAYFAKD